MNIKRFPTLFPELNDVLDELVTAVSHTLQHNFIAAYLQGSFGMGAGDEHSDVDFLIVIDQPLFADEVVALQAIHGHIYDLAPPWSTHLEGSYFPQATLKADGVVGEPLYFLDNCSRELVLSDHDNDLIVRWVTREHGITLYGPEAKSLIDPVPTDALRRKVLDVMHTWGKEIITGSYEIESRWAQSFAVLSYCRMIHTLHCSRIESKQAGATWAQTAVSPQFQPFIQLAWEERPFPSQKVYQQVEPDMVTQTIAFIQYTLENYQEITGFME